MHFATPDAAAAHDGSDIEEALGLDISAQVTIDICEYQDSQGYLASVEQPVGAKLFE